MKEDKFAIVSLLVFGGIVLLNVAWIGVLIWATIKLVGWVTAQ